VLLEWMHSSECSICLVTLQAEIASGKIGLAFTRPVPVCVHIMSKIPESLFKVIFMNQGKVYEIYAREISEGGLFAFLEVEEMVFGEKTSLVVDPSEEKLKTEFAGVQRSYIPLHHIIRIDEVETKGVSKITKVDGDNVTHFPSPIYTPTTNQN